MQLTKATKIKKARRANRTRARVKGISTRPRLSVFRSNRMIYAQLIDDTAMKTLVSASAKGLSKGKRTKTEEAAAIGELLASKAKEKGIKRAVFDRGGYLYHGRVKAVADGARKGGLEF